MSIDLLKEGVKVVFYVVKRNDRCAFREFVDGLQLTDRKKVLALLDRTLRVDIPKNKQKFKHLEDGIYEFKSDKIRLLGFFLENEIKKSFVFVECFRKQKRWADKNVIDRVKKIREEELGGEDRHER